MPVDLYQLRYFLEVARELNFTRAAGNMNISPSACSRSVALLERSVGKKLFARTKRHVALTADGAALAAHAQKVFDELERARQTLAGGDAGGPALVRIGTREMITHYLLPEPLKEWRARFPQTRFGLYELGPRELAEALLKDQIDFGFYYSEIAGPGLESRRLGRLESHVYVSRALLGKGRAPKAFEEVLKLPFIAPRGFLADPAAPSADGFPDQRHARDIRFEGEFLETHRRFVLEGLAAAVLPDLVVAEELRKGAVLALEGPALYRDIFFYKRKGKPLPKAVDGFLASVGRAIGLRRGPKT